MRTANQYESDPNYKELLKYAITDKQREVVQSCIDEGSQSAAARKLGTVVKNLNKIIRRMEERAGKQGYSRNGDVIRDIEHGFHLKGKSVFVDNTTGDAQRTWYKYDLDKEAQLEAMQDVVEQLKQEIKPRPKIKNNYKNHNENLLNLYTLTDFHVGMLAWEKETGDKWNIPLATEIARKAFAHLIKASPDAETAVFCENGDFAHFDSLDAVTPMNKHILDADGRAPKMIGACIDIMIDAIEQLAMKYKKVIVIASEGNHNPVGAIWMSELLSRYYSKNDRIEVVTSPKPYHAVEWGVNMLGFAHGHLAKGKRLIDVFISDNREMYGRTKLLHIHTGHTHHRELKESSTAILETHPTMAGRDAYAARGGWQSDRCMQVISYHKDFKEVSRNMVHVDML